MFNFLKKGKKQNDDFLPYNLKLGSYVEFDPILFSNLGLDSKFLFSGYKNIVVKVDANTSASDEQFSELLEYVKKTSPVLDTITNPVTVKVELV